jgi:hypothetical protein
MKREKKKIKGMVNHIHQTAADWSCDFAENSVPESH